MCSACTRSSAGVRNVKLQHALSLFARDSIPVGFFSIPTTSAWYPLSRRNRSSLPPMKHSGADGRRKADFSAIRRTFDCWSCNCASAPIRLMLNCRRGGDCPLFGGGPRFIQRTYSATLVVPRGRTDVASRTFAMEEVFVLAPDIPLRHQPSLTKDDPADGRNPPVTNKLTKAGEK